MRKHLVSFLALLLVAQLGWAAVTPASQIPTYWSSADGKSGSALWSAISTQTNVGYKSLSYNGLWTAYATTDVYPGTNKIWDMYGECDFTYSTDKCGSYSGVCDCYNREHSIPQSYWGGGTSGIGCDIFHLVPTDGKINGVRSNDEFGEVNGGTDWNGNKSGSAGSWSTDKKTIASTAGEVVNGSGNVFEPKDQYKGDFARGYMGTIIKWQLSGLTTDNHFFSGIYDAAHYFGFTKKAVVLMMKWHREDPVSQKEIDRNNGIQQTQGNRNPFIDYPYLAEYIWGERAGETVDMSMLMPSTDPNFVPGESNGWRGGDVPPGPQPATPKFGVTWSANGVAFLTDSVAQNTNIIGLPSTPISCSQESDQFMGWTDAPISGTTDIAPAVLYTKPAEFPAVTEDITYYAVFARLAEMEPSLPASFTFDADHQEGWTNTGKVTGSYWLLKEGHELVSPEMDLAGLTSIQMTMRTYGGASNNTVHIIANNQEIGTLVAASNTMAEKTWTNNQTLSGIAAIHFTANYTASNAGVGFSAVTINGTGTADVYCRFITSCQEPSEVINIVSEETAAKKIIVNGQLFIQTPDGLFNLQGQRVK